jgi:hypothetical protein
MLPSVIGSIGSVGEGCRRAGCSRSKSSRAPRCHRSGWTRDIIVAMRRVIRDREPCNVIQAQCHTSFAQRQSDCASLMVFVGSREPMLTLIAEGKRQPAALRCQEIGLELVASGPLRLLACLPGTFVTPDNLCSERLEQVRCCSRHHHTEVVTLYRDNAPRPPPPTAAHPARLNLP